MNSDPTRLPRQVINATPLRSIPLPADSNTSPVHPQEGSVGTSQPSFMSFQTEPSEPSEQEWKTLLSAAPGAVRLSGSAAMGMVGPIVGQMNIGENSDSYIFRISLPGVARESFKCNVTPSGLVSIEGFTTTGDTTVYRNGIRFEMLTQNLCPPGHFSISFKLPGPVASDQLTACFGIDGVFEGAVRKKI